MAIKKEFTPDLVALGKEFDLEKNRVKRQAYKANHTHDQKKEVLEKWKEFMKEISSNVPFFEYFENHLEWHKKSCVVTKTNWTKEDTKEVVRSSHPPLDKINFKHKKVDVVASPFQLPTSEEVVFSKVIALNNYTNQCLHVIGKQLDRMEEKVENKVILQLGNPSKPSPALEKPLVKLPTTRQASLKSKDQTTLEVCLQKMEELVEKEPVTPSPNTTSSSKLVVLNTYTASSSSSRASSDNEKEIEKLENQFRGLEVKILYQPTPTTLTKNRYPRPTPPDLQFEERNSHQFSVTSGKLYEWNVDGLAEQEILKKIHHMTMVANNYLNEGRSYIEVIELMSLGFTGKLLQLWNNYLIEESKEDIKHAVQKDEEGTPIFDECIGKGVPDGVNTLIYTIMKHFVGKPSNITSRVYDQLSNLRCKNLGEYKWYV